jgi:hypothetical protein
LAVGSSGKIIGFGFVCFVTLEGASRARFEAPKEPFRKIYQLTVSQFEPREIRIARKTELSEKIELDMHKKALQRQETHEKLKWIKE